MGGGDIHGYPWALRRFVSFGMEGVLGWVAMGQRLTS